MDLKYRILWFDDQPNQAKGIEDYITARLNELGLTLGVTWVTTFDDSTLNPLILKLRSYSPYDLILVDYDLSAKLKGDALLKKLRNNTNGEMVFYSAKDVAQLRQLLLLQKVDGIYSLRRDGRLGNEIFAIVESTLRRFFHPNYMRGLVVGSVSELETTFADMIMLLLSSCKDMPTENEIKDLILSGAKEHLASEQNRLSKFEETPLSRLVSKANLHAKLDILKILLSKHDGRIAADALAVLSKFLDEINTPRIEFAHARTVEEQGLPVFRERQGKVWTSLEMKALLLKLRQHKEAAASIVHLKDT